FLFFFFQAEDGIRDFHVTGVQTCALPIFDLYSFPSGHTMNAVNFAVLFSVFYPPLLWLVLPFTLLVGLSRVILGMHYPTDVLVGAVLGLLIAYSSLLLWPAGMFAGMVL